MRRWTFTTDCWKVECLVEDQRAPIHQPHARARSPPPRNATRSPTPSSCRRRRSTAGPCGRRVVDGSASRPAPRRPTGSPARRRDQATTAAPTARTAPPVACGWPGGDPVKDPALPCRPRPGLVSKLQYTSASGGSEHTQPRTAVPSGCAGKIVPLVAVPSGLKGERIGGIQPDRIGVSRHRATIGYPSDPCCHAEYDPGKRSPIRSTGVIGSSTPRRISRRRRPLPFPSTYTA